MNRFVLPSLVVVLVVISIGLVTTGNNALDLQLATKTPKENVSASEDTSIDLPPVWTATPLPPIAATPTVERVTVTWSSEESTVTPTALPQLFFPFAGPTPLGGGSGSIAYVSERDGNQEIYTMKLDGSEIN